MRNDTSYQAPSLHHIGLKAQDNPTGQFYMLPQALTDIIFNELGNSSAQLRIMMVLCGTKEGFFISEKWICDRTGLKRQSYERSRDELVKRGWITHNEYSTINIHYDKIYACGKDKKEQ